MTIGRDEIGQRSETVRRANLSAIVRELHERGPLSRSELVARTGLTRSAIRGLIGELVAAGLAAEEPAVRLGTPGRPSPLVRPNPRAPSSWPSRSRSTRWPPRSSGSAARSSSSSASTGRAGTRRSTRSSAISSALAAGVRRPAGRRTTRSIGVGVAVAGVVRRSDGLVSMAPEPRLERRPARRAARARPSAAGVPISVANEADLGVLAEHRRGAARGVDDVLYISGEVGVGGGLIVDGRPLTGVAGYGGEIGHIPVNPGGTACRCGSVGCWETEVGEGALLRPRRAPADGGRRAVEAVLARGRRRLARRARCPRPRRAAGSVSGWPASSTCSTRGSSSSAACSAGSTRWSSATLEEELDRRALPAPRALVRVVPASLGVDAPLLGAAELAFEPLLADPAAWVGPRDALAELESA